MSKTLSGLFTGPSAADVRMAMGLESDARIRQAGEDAKAGGFIPSYIAQARQKGVEALQPLMGAGIQFFGGEVPQDPRLAKALKRDQDKKFIINKLGTLAGEDGQWNETEMMEGYKLLMERGYPEEARKFLADAKIMADIEYTKNVKGQKSSADKRSLSKTKLIQDKDGNKYFARMESVGGVNKTVYSPLNSNAPKTPVGTGAEIKIIDDNVGQTGDVKLQRALAQAKFRSTLTKEEAKVKSDLAVEEALLKKKNETQFETRNKYVAAGVKARRSRENVSTVLSLAKRLNTGGLAAVESEIKSFFGIQRADEGEFNARTGNLVLAVLKDLLGSRPTDADLKFLVNKMAGMVKSKKVNIRLLEAALDKIDNTIAIGDWWSQEENAKKNLSDFNVSLKEKGVGIPNSATSPLRLPSGRDFDEWWGSLPVGTFYIDPQGNPREKK